MGPAHEARDDGVGWCGGGRGLLPQPHRKHRPQRRVAQPQAGPQEQAQIDAEQGVADQRALGSHLGRHGAAQEAREQHRAQEAGARDQVEHQARKLDDPDRQGVARVPAQLGQGSCRRRVMQQFRPHRAAGDEQGERPRQHPLGPGRDLLAHAHGLSVWDKDG
ncbi:hypothetical protein CC_3519 [Caulobacter vibrioides CB15]|uniref:Uncharacterized protein n=1 Tax=Caulobacter vibrioides (strain ATCC 19089 / CIP 103742 / CB 15) TaxID=190650 RepID=Q9A2N7_CAUVC|nr:hypothetical protein CC_3519 [Caulobacter vibrioides CB15]